jgi:NAD-dependent SIR2 family protein deacetylase
MQGQLGQVSDLKRRLYLCEESLRKETLVNEEQRAYINVLREALELKFHNAGLQFKGTSLTGVVIESNVDGFLQLINSQRAVDQLRGELQKLH